MQIPLLRQSPCELQLWLHVAARSWGTPLPPSGRACAQRASKQKAVAAQCDIIQNALVHTSSPPRQRRRSTPTPAALRAASCR